MLEWLSLVSSGVTLGLAGPTLHAYASGFSLARKIQQIDDKLESRITDMRDNLHDVKAQIDLISEGVYTSDKPTFSNQSKVKVPRPQSILQTPELKVAPHTILDRPSALPQNLRDLFFQNPENFLSRVERLDASNPDLSLINDETMVPWFFEKDGTRLVGFAKIGLLDAMGIRYSPLLNKDNLSVRSASKPRPSAPARATPTPEPANLDRFRTISDVADELDVPAHVLRFWESKFSQVKPIKRAAGRRYYRPADVALLKWIKTQLHGHGLTIKMVQSKLRQGGIAELAALHSSAPSAPKRDDRPPRQLKGFVFAQKVVVPAGTTIFGDVCGNEVEISGGVEGNIIGAKVRLKLGSFIRGDIVHNGIAIEPSVRFEGSVQRSPEKVAEMLAFIKTNDQKSVVDYPGYFTFRPKKS